ncbi:MAG TPA: Yip1 family protein [Pseudomonadales bacterium]|jgi:Yip1 domain|nr:Yip1 family protein [Pseudomonadales bacterium]
MEFEPLVARVKAILLNPGIEWPVIATESTTVAALYRNYIIVLAAIPAVFGFIKGSVFGVDVPLIGNMRVSIGAGLSGMVLSYALSLVQVYLIALIVDVLAPTFKAQRSQIQALKLAAYAFTAAWVAGLAQIVPWLGTLLVLAGGFYSIYLFYLGLPSVMKCPPDQAVAYTAVCIIVAIVLGAIVAYAVGSITGGGIPGRTTSSDIQFDKNSPIGKLDDWTKKMEQASKEVEAAQQSGDAAAQSAAVGNMLGTALGGKVEALAPDKLKPFVPNSLDSLPRTELSVDRSGAMGMQISEAHATYAGDNRSLRLEITDTGSAKGLVALAGLASVQEDKETASGFSKTYSDDGRMIHEEWDNGGSGEYSVVVGNRFTVKVSGNAHQLADLKAALDEIDLAGLEALKDEGVAQE